MSLSSFITATLAAASATHPFFGHGPIVISTTLPTIATTPTPAPAPTALIKRQDYKGDYSSPYFWTSTVSACACAQEACCLTESNWIASTYSMWMPALIWPQDKHMVASGAIATPTPVETTPGLVVPTSTSTAVDSQKSMPSGLPTGPAPWTCGCSGFDACGNHCCSSDFGTCDLDRKKLPSTLSTKTVIKSPVVELNAPTFVPTLNDGVNKYSGDSSKV
ncbi:hypothetical protein LTS08_003501 [Lithohypha guttulata]|nr:hypothetical protein LTS08_003501 [Lithohypha guttulata]